MDEKPETFHFVEIEDVLVLLDVLELGPIRDVGLIESALHRPRAIVFGNDVYEGLFHKAAVLLDSLVRNHGLVDGNKRLAWTCTFLFLRINGQFLDAGRRVNFDFMLSCARGDLDVEQITKWLATNAQPV